jgi:hypothetical protein
MRTYLVYRAEVDFAEADQPGHGASKVVFSRLDYVRSVANPDVHKPTLAQGLEGLSEDVTANAERLGEALFGRELFAATYIPLSDYRLKLISNRI